MGRKNRDKFLALVGGKAPRVIDPSRHVEADDPVKRRPVAERKRCEGPFCEKFIKGKRVGRHGQLRPWSRFCGDACRMDWHAEQRRAKRAAELQAAKAVER